jgi:outer membrane protein TolC
VLANPSRDNEIGGRPLLNPQAFSSVDLEYRQPLLQGGGRPANLAPILIARIETERSFYQLKSSLQQMVGGVIEAYWALVFARTDLWARRQQVQQNQWAFEQAEARFRRGLGDAGDVAQARSTLADFRARLVTARASLLQREAALRNILGIPPSDGREIVPVSPPQLEWIETDWQTVLRTAEQYRPDLIELKLILEQDQQNLLLARNRSLPRLDATALYRWNHLEGRIPDGRLVAAEPGQFTGWQLGVEVAVPLALADARAELRRQELIVTRDRANLNQTLHAAGHDLANSYRNLAQFYEEYKAFKETREAARINLNAQTARWSNGLTIYLNVLQAISAWGNAVDAEAQALLQYNSELANLARQSGTILESHGVMFTEEGFPSVGPLGRLFPDHCYPRDTRARENADRYPAGSEPAENVFALDDLQVPRRRPQELPPPRPDQPRAPTPEDLRRMFLPPDDPEFVPRSAP